MNIWVKMVLIALTGGIIGYLSGFPIGALLGSFLIIGIIQFRSNKFPSLPLPVKRSIQIVIGGSVGLSFSHETIYLLKNIWAPALILFSLHTLFALLIAYLIVRFLKIDTITALCSAAPAGFSEMLLIAENYNASMTTVIIIHLFRVLLIVTCIPMVLLFF